MAAPRIPEQNKKPGVHYTVSDDGIELPIIDITHPAFALSITDAELRAQVNQYLFEPQPWTKLPAFLRNWLLKLVLRGSALAPVLEQPDGWYLSGMKTYMLKLGPDNLGTGYANRVDRRIAASLPSLSVRRRLEDMARLQADSLEPRLLRNPNRPLHLINIAGGTAVDSISTLLLLHKKHRQLLVDRPISICVLDGDTAGPNFGSRALEVLQAKKAPLHSLQISFRRFDYNWRHPAGMNAVLDVSRAENAITIGSSEGGLFEYGSDQEITGNLDCLRRGTDDEFVMVGSVTRADGPIQKLRQLSRPGTRPRGIDVFRKLVESAGWRVERVNEGPFSDQVVVAPRAG